jgi:hypothetical protein
MMLVGKREKRLGGLDQKMQTDPSTVEELASLLPLSAGQLELEGIQKFEAMQRKYTYIAPVSARRHST